MKKLNKEQKPIAVPSPGSVANAPVSRRKLSEKQALARIRMYEEAWEHLELDCHDDAEELAQSRIVVAEIKRLSKNFERRFYGG